MMDVAELNLLSGLQDKRARQVRVAAQQSAAINRIAGYQADGTLPAATTPTAQADADDMGITNRSPTTTTNNHNHYYPTVVEPAPSVAQPSPVNPWPWIFLTILTLALLGAAGLLWLSSRPQQAFPKPGSYGLGLDDLKVY